MRAITGEMPMARVALLIAMQACSLALRPQAAEVLYDPQDRALLEARLEQVASGLPQPVGETMASSGKAFLQTPYVEKTLETGDQELLVVNLRGLDCTTFVENALAITRMVHSGEEDWESYLGQLQHIRYRDGERAGYPSRLHYFTEWIRNNEQKGLLKDVTEEIGGVRIEKQINFMGTHPGSYPALAADDNLDRVRATEAMLSAGSYYILPREEVPRKEALIREGDIIALATDIPGLDVTHTGIAIRGQDGRIHLLHASTRGAVVISEDPLAEYLRGIKGNSGIIVARPQPPKH